VTVLGSRGETITAGNRDRLDFDSGIAVASFVVGVVTGVIAGTGCEKEQDQQDREYPTARAGTETVGRCNVHVSRLNLKVSKSI
jgi:hypothetical protein